MTAPKIPAAMKPLRELIAEATPGKWHVEDPLGPEILCVVSGNEVFNWKWVVQAGRDSEDGTDITQTEMEANVELIARLNPVTALAVLEALEHAKEHIAGQEIFGWQHRCGEIDRALSLLNPTMNHNDDRPDYSIFNRAPEFPCEMWGDNTRQWHYFLRDDFGPRSAGQYKTHGWSRWRPLPAAAKLGGDAAHEILGDSDPRATPDREPRAAIKFDAFNQRLLNIAAWCGQRARGKHDRHTTASMLTRKGEELRALVVPPTPPAATGTPTFLKGDALAAYLDKELVTAQARIAELEGRLKELQLQAAGAIEGASKYAAAGMYEESEAVARNFDDGVPLKELNALRNRAENAERILAAYRNDSQEILHAIGHNGHGCINIPEYITALLTAAKGAREALELTNKFLSEEVYAENGQDPLRPPEPADDLSYKAVGHIQANAITLAALIAALETEGKTL